MAEWFDVIMQFFVEWGYAGMFLAALAAGSIIPIGSEVVFIGLLGLGLDPVGLIARNTSFSVAHRIKVKTL